MKKKLALLLVTLMVFAFSSCAVLDVVKDKLGLSQTSIQTESSIEKTSSQNSESEEVEESSSVEENESSESQYSSE